MKTVNNRLFFWKIFKIFLFFLNKDVESIEFLETIYQVDPNEVSYASLKLIRNNMSTQDEIFVELNSEYFTENSKCKYIFEWIS